MRTYEVVYILDPAIGFEAADAKLERLHALATVGGGSVDTVEHWGQRRLAYQIGGHDSGYYAVAHITAAAEALPEFERLLKLDEEVMRHLLVINEGENTSGASKMAEAYRTGDERAGGQDVDGGDGDGGGEGPDDPDAEQSAETESADAAAEPTSGDASTSASATGAPTSDDATSASATEAPTSDDANSPVSATEEPASAEDESEAGPDGDGATANTPPQPNAGPPEFSGPGGRRRRAEGPPIVLLDYKDVKNLSYFITDQGKILPKRTTRVTARFQRRLGRAIKRARYLALIPYTGSFDN